MMLVLVTLTVIPLALESSPAALVRETPVQVHPVVQLVEDQAEVMAELAELAALEVKEGIYPLEMRNLEAAFPRIAHQVVPLAL